MPVSVTPRKNPLHPSALGLNDLIPGRQLVLVRLGLVQIDVTVCARPYKSYQYDADLNQFYATLSVELMDSYGYWETSLADIGVIPEDVATRRWSDDSFVIDARKRHLLPSANGQPSRRQQREAFRSAMSDHESFAGSPANRWGGILND